MSYEGAIIQARKDLMMQANIVSNRHIKSGFYRSKFLNDIEFWAQCPVEITPQGRQRVDALSALKKEKSTLIEQSLLIGQKGIGFIAGAMMVTGGAATCYFSAASLCALATPVMAHGVNNMYENGKYFVDGDESATGLVRKFYQWVAQSEKYGDIAYYSVDLFMSAKGVFGLSNELKAISKANQISGYKPVSNMIEAVPIKADYSWLKHAKSEQFKLFRYSSEDFLRGYEAASKPSLAIEGLSDASTIQSLSGKITDD